MDVSRGCGHPAGKLFASVVSRNRSWAYRNHRHLPGRLLSSIAASVDWRYRLAIPVYGRGFLGADSYWVPEFAKMGSGKSSRWLGLWDPSVYLGRAKMPFLWVAGTNDFAYSMDSLQKPCRLPRTARTR